jgi:hypothetical protein
MRKFFLVECFIGHGLEMQGFDGFELGSSENVKKVVGLTLANSKIAGIAIKFQEVR